MSVQQEGIFFVRRKVGVRGQGLDHGKKEIQIVAALGIHYANAVEPDIQPTGTILDCDPVTEKDRDAALLCRELAGCLNNSRIASLGENDAFGMPLQLAQQ
jgi:hypothetical protein